MSYSVFPAASAAAATTPIGGTTTVFSGYASLSSYTYTGSLAAGSYLLVVNPQSQEASYLVTAPASGANAVVTGNSTVAIKTTTTETAFNISPYLVWTSRVHGFGSTTGVSYIDYANGLFIAQGGSTLRISSDGITWIGKTQPGGANGSYGVTYGASTWVCASGNTNGIFTSTNLITWTSRQSGFTSLYHTAGVVFGNGIFVTAGSGGALSTSTDGITWTTRNSALAPTEISGLTYGTVWVCAAAYLMSTSTDGITWTTRNSGFGTTGINRLAYGNGLYVAVGNNNTITTSTDAITWTARTPSYKTSQAITNIAYGNGLFVAGDSGGNAITSTDGITWNSYPTGISSNNTGVATIAYNKSINRFAIGGYDGVSVLYTAPCAPATFQLYNTTMSNLN